MQCVTILSAFSEQSVSKRLLPLPQRFELDLFIIIFLKRDTGMQLSIIRLHSALRLPWITYGPFICALVPVLLSLKGGVYRAKQTQLSYSITERVCRALCSSRLHIKKEKYNHIKTGQ